MVIILYYVLHIHTMQVHILSYCTRFVSEDVMGRVSTHLYAFKVSSPSPSSAMMRDLVAD